jgi:putative RecB family exonuclease
MIKLSHSYSALKEYENCPQRYYRTRIVKDVKDQGGEASKHGERVHKHLEDRLRDGTPLPDELVSKESLVVAVEGLAKPGDQLLVEKELTLNESLQPTGWWDSDAWLRSKLDVLVIKQDKAVVIDWKTGKRRPDFFQMQMFAAQVFKHYKNVQVVKTSLVWLPADAMDTETYNRIDMATIWGGIENKISRIEQSVEHDNWPARPSGLCPWCPAKPTCKWAK